MRLRSIAPASAFIAIGHLLFIGLFILAVQHWMVRTIHVDSACQIFKWINNNGLQIEAHRYTAIFPQIVVKLFAWCGASLSTLLLVASVAHVLVPWIIYSLLAHVLHRPWHAVAVALAAVLCARLTFYGIVLEVNYLLCYPFLLSAALDLRSARPDHRWSLALVLFALALLVLVHPLGALVALFIIALHFARGRKVRDLLLGAVVIGWILLGRLLLPPTGYEQGLYDGIGAGWTSLSLGMDQPALDFFLGHTWGYTTHYVAWWLLFATVLVLLGRRKAWGDLLVVLGGVVAFILLTVLTYHEGETAMMMEKNFLPLATLVAMPLLLEVEQMDRRTQWIALAPFVAVLFLQFRGVSFASRPANERIVFLRGVVADARLAGSGSVAMEEQALDARGLHIHWALAYETLLLSSVEGTGGPVIVRAVRDGQVIGHVIDPTTLDQRWFGHRLEGDPVLSTH